MIQALLLLLLAGSAHPMHTSVAEVRYEAVERAASISIRLYSDDLATAVPGAQGSGADSAVSRYVRGRFSLVDATGRPLPLAWVGARRTEDTVVLVLRAPLAGGLRGIRIGSTLLHERFRDQVNVVRVSAGAGTATLLFLRGDAPKSVP